MEDGAKEGMPHLQHEKPKSAGPRGGHDMSAMFQSNERALKISAWLTGVYFVIELGLGVFSGSIAVLSDAFHTFSAVGGVLLALVAGRIALRPADRFRTFGSSRAEIVGALLNGLFLLAMAILVLYMGVLRLLQPVAIASGLMIVAAVLGLVTETVSLRLLLAGQKENINIRGAFWHVVQTFVGSLIIIVAAVVILLTGYLAIDPILGMGFGLILLWVSWGIIRDSLRVVMETVPTDVDIDAVIAAFLELKGVEDVHHVHAWALTTGKNLLSAHLHVADDAEQEAVLSQAREIVRARFGFYFSTLQVEKSRCFEEGAEDIDFLGS